MAFIFIHLLIIVGALWTAARNVYEPQQYRRSIEVGDVQGNLTELPLKDVGYTQDTIDESIHNNSPVKISLESVLAAARSDPEGPVSYLRAKFPQPLVIYRHPQFGLLSIDNRRLYLFKTVAPDGGATIPVEIVTEEEAGNRLRDLRRDKEKITPEEALKDRLTTKTKGKSIEIRTKGGGNGSGSGSSKKPTQTPGTSGTQGSSRNKPGTSGTQSSSSKQGSSKPGSSNKPGSSKPGGPGTSSQGGFGKSSGPKKQGGSKPSRRPKRHVAYRIRH